MPTTVKLIEQRASTSWAGLALEALRSYTLGPFSLKYPTDPTLAKWLGSGRSTSAGITVSDEMAFTFSAVYDAVNQISSDVAKVPLNLHKRRQAGGSDLFTDSKLYRLLKDEPNPDMSSFVFRQTLMAHALTSHGGYAEIERDAGGRPSALWVLTPDRVAPFLDQQKLPSGLYRSRLKYRVDGSTVLDSANVLHIRGLGYDGYRAYPVIDMARQAIGLALAAERFGSTFFGNGAKFGGVVSTDLAYGPDKEEELKKQIAAYAGSGKAHQMLFLSGGWKYTQVGVAPNEAQMDELRDKQVEEVARFFDMPLHKLKLNKPGAVSYASVEMAGLDYLTGCLLKWYVNAEQEYNRKLIPPLEARQQFFKHNVNAFMRGDSAGRSSFYSAMLDRGVYCADDVLELEDMNPQPGGQGKLFLVQSAMVPKDKLGAVVDAQITSKTRPKQVAAPAPVDPNARGELEMVLEQLAQAETAAAAARAEAQTEREARVALVATGTAQDGEIARRVASELALYTRAAALEVEAAGLRSERAVLLEAQEHGVAERDALRAESEARQASLVAVTAERDARAADVAGQAEQLAILAADVAAARAEVAARGTEVEAAWQRAVDLEAVRLALEVELTQARASQEQLRSQQEAATLAAQQADEARAQAEQRATEAAGAVTEARAAVDRSVADLLRVSADQQADRAAREAAEQRATEAAEVQAAAVQDAAMLRIEADAAGIRATAALAAVGIQEAMAAVQLTRIAELEAREQQAELDRQTAATAQASMESRLAAATESASDLSGQVVAAEAERDILRQSLAEAETARQAAQEAVRATEVAQAEALALLASEHATADAERSALAGRLATQAEQLAAADVARVDLEARRAQTEAELRAAEVLRQASETETAAAQAVAEAQRVALEQQVAERAGQVTELERERGVLLASRAAAVEAVRVAEESRTAVQVEAAAARALSEAQRAEFVRQDTERVALVTELERQVVEVRDADARGVAAVIAAHRALVVDIMRQMVEWETERLRRSQATPEKLRERMGTFYDGFTDLVRKRLEPVIAVHLAFIRSGEDPKDEARRYAEGHVRESLRQLQFALDGDDPEAYAGSVTALWHRWETERTNQIADRLMQTELEYIRHR